MIWPRVFVPSNEKYHLTSKESSDAIPCHDEKDEDGYLVTECPALPGCVSQGKDE